MSERRASGQPGRTGQADQGKQAKKPDQPVVISADKDVKYEAVIQVMDLLQQNQVKKVGLAGQTALRLTLHTVKEPGRVASGALAVMVHLMFFGLLVFGISWQKKIAPRWWSTSGRTCPNRQKASCPRSRPSRCPSLYRRRRSLCRR